MFLVRAPLVLALWAVAVRAVDPAAEAVRLQTITRSTGACPTNVATLALPTNASQMVPAAVCSFPAGSRAGSGAGSGVRSGGRAATCGAAEAFMPEFHVGRCASCAKVTQPGFLCKDHAITMCPSGFYCPLDAKTGSYTEQKTCPDKHVCMTGFVAPLECRDTESCKEGTSRKEAGSGIITVFSVLNGIAVLLAIVLWVREENHHKQSQRLREGWKASGKGLGHGIKQYTKPVHLVFKDLGMRLKSNDKEILTGVTGCWEPGSLVALMGPSGCGKTTFMNALLGRAHYAHTSGEVLINNAECSLATVSSVVGFVPQDDIMRADLTVFQCLYYNAMLRLPHGVDDATKLKHVQDVIESLGISHIQNELVGDASKRGISGGQKKRVNIGMELVAMPNIIFMDEPTSGLDGAATLELAECLSSLRKSGLTIVCTIHQPRFSVFKEFTHLMLLGKGGQTVFSGSTSKIMPYMNENGFEMPQGENAADWMIDIVCGLVPKLTAAGAVDPNFEAPADLFRWWSEQHKAASTDPRSPMNVAENKDGAVVQRTGSKSFDEIQQLSALEQRVLPGLWRQVWSIGQRRSRQFEALQFFGRVILMFACGLLFGQLSRDSTKQGGEYVALPYTRGYAEVPAMMIGLSSHALFYSERLPAAREMHAGVNPFAYWLASVLYDIVISFFYTTAYVVPYFAKATPLMPLLTFADAWLAFCWYWSGVGMLAAILVTDGTLGIMVCVFVPLLEMFWNGVAQCETLGYINEMGSIKNVFSQLSAGRWHATAVYTDELLQLPAHALHFTVNSELMQKFGVDEADVAGEATKSQRNLWLLAFALHVIVLLAQLYEKYQHSISPMALARRCCKKSQKSPEYESFELGKQSIDVRAASADAGFGA